MLLVFNVIIFVLCICRYIGIQFFNLIIHNLMPHRLKVVILDDDKFALEMVNDMCYNSKFVEIVGSYTDPREFITAVPRLQFDIILLDILMPGMDGIAVARLMNHKPIIFITSAEEKLKEALELEPIDIITKPYTKERLQHALEKAYKLIYDGIKEYAMFNIAESNHKIKIKLADIIHVATDESDPRNKLMELSDGTTYTVMDCTLEELLRKSPKLVQVNRGELVSLDA